MIPGSDESYFVKFSGAKSIKIEEVQVLKAQTFRRFKVSNKVLESAKMIEYKFFLALTYRDRLIPNIKAIPCQ